MIIQKQIFSQRLMKALKRASELFEDIKRKDGCHYTIHLFGVMHIAAQFTDDEDVIIAALMHDTLEDIDSEIYSEENLRTDFGDKVADLVLTVSHFVTDKINKKKSREIYLENIKNGPLESIIITASDLLNNLIDMISLLNSDSFDCRDNFFDPYDESFKLRIWFYAERARIISERLGSEHPLTKEVQASLSKYIRLIKLLK
jgi:(p)ppGpp synthase/HD superfamily hydrolase